MTREETTWLDIDPAVIASLAVAARAVRCPRWEWMPGMLAIHAAGESVVMLRVCALDADGLAWVEVHEDPEGAMSDPRGWRSLAPDVPDFEDGATLGCLLALVRKSWGERVVTAWRHDHRTGDFVWAVQQEPHDPVIPPSRPAAEWRPSTIASGRTEAEALVAALEAAP